MARYPLAEIKYTIAKVNEITATESQQFWNPYFAVTRDAYTGPAIWPMPRNILKRPEDLSFI